MAYKTVNLATKYGPCEFVINGRDTGIVRFPSITINGVEYTLTAHFNKGERFEKGGPWKEIYDYFWMRRKDTPDYPSEPAKKKAFDIVNEILDENEAAYALEFEEVGRMKREEEIKEKRKERQELVKRIQALETEISELDTSFYSDYGRLPVNELTTV